MTVDYFRTMTIDYFVSLCSGYWSMWFSYCTFDSCPRGSGIVAAGVSKKIFQMAGVDDCYTSACGTTATVGNFDK